MKNFEFQYENPKDYDENCSTWEGLFNKWLKESDSIDELVTIYEAEYDD